MLKVYWTVFQSRLQSPDSGKHLHDVLDLLQKHTLVEADISAQAERIKAVQGAAQRFTSYEQGESFTLFTQLLLTLEVIYLYIYIYMMPYICVLIVSLQTMRARIS